MHTEAGMIQGARIQYRNYFRTMSLGGSWCIYRTRENESLSGVVLCTMAEAPSDAPILVRDVQAKSENQIAILLSDAIRYGAYSKRVTGEDVGYLQHGVAPGPFRTESVRIKNEYADRWLAFFEGRWRRVHVQLRRTYIVFKGVKITIQIDGV